MTMIWYDMIWLWHDMTMTMGYDYDMIWLCGIDPPSNSRQFHAVSILLPIFRHQAERTLCLRVARAAHLGCPRDSTTDFGWLVVSKMGMDQYLLIPFLGGWTSIYQLFWCSPGVQGFDTLPNKFRQPSPAPFFVPWIIPVRWLFNTHGAVPSHGTTVWYHMISYDYVRLCINVYDVCPKL